uniref:POU domain protein n=1 Tax=Rhabditophanes sp. KR3021 TaxID=114890 RepID=A0AC35TPD7_9BILA
MLTMAIAPEFEQTEYRINVTEELPQGTIVFLDFEANDADQDGENSMISYKILQSEHSKYLEIKDPIKPIITVKERIDFEQITQFTVEIEARDGGEPSLASTAKLYVTVLDIDDQNPFFSHELYYTNSISDSTFEVFPSPIFAKDGDSLNEPIFYELSGDHHEEFAINATGSVRLLGDEVPSTIIFVHAKQLNKPERASLAILRIANQTSIEFQHYMYSVQISSQSAIGMELLKVKATTSNQNSIINYSIVDDSTNLVSIDEETGKIELVSNPSKAQYTIKLMASDGKARTWSQLHVTVTNLNNYEPEFEKKAYKFDIKDSALLGQVRAVDRDANDTVEYRLLNLNALFRIDQEGMLSVKNMHSLNPSTIYEVIILAEDNQNHKAFTNIKITSKRDNTEMLSTIFGSIVFIILSIGMIAVIYYILRKAKKIVNMYLLLLAFRWCDSKSRNLWMSNSSDQGVIISDSYDSSKSDVSTIRATNHRALYDGSAPELNTITDSSAALSFRQKSNSPPSMSTFTSTQLPSPLSQTPLSNTISGPNPIGLTSCGNSRLVPVTVQNQTGTPTINLNMDNYFEEEDITNIPNYQNTSMNWDNQHASTSGQLAEHEDALSSSLIDHHVQETNYQYDPTINYQEAGFSYHYGITNGNYHHQTKVEHNNTQQRQAYQKVDFPHYEFLDHHHQSFVQYDFYNDDSIYSHESTLQINSLHGQHICVNNLYEARYHGLPILPCCLRKFQPNNVDRNEEEVEYSRPIITELEPIYKSPTKSIEYRKKKASALKMLPLSPIQAPPPTTRILSNLEILTLHYENKMKGSELEVTCPDIETSRNEMMDFFSRAYQALDKKTADNGVVIKSKTSQTQGERNEDAGAILPTPPNTPAIDNNHPQFSEGGVQVGDIEEFALMFKNARIRFGFTQGDVGKHIGERFGSEFSQTTISRFEALNLSFKNMIKLRPQLTIWLTETEKFLKLGKTADEINNEKMHLMSNSAVSEEIKFEEMGMESPTERKRTYEDDPNGSIKKRRKRTNLEKFQRDHLTALFNLNQRPDEDQLENIATGLGLEVAVCRVWFCNRRQKERRNSASN